MPKIVITDYGLGNLRSVQKALVKTHAEVSISNAEDELLEADALILPGVGAFRDAVNNIHPLKSTIFKHYKLGKPLLGICLGLQLLFTESTEGGLYFGLDLLPGRVVHLPTGLKVPHMGWNTLQIVDATNPLVEGVSSGQYVYFVHSYYGKLNDSRNIVALTKYGVNFPSIVAKKGVFATQFHPEKSGRVGLKILENFVKYVSN